MPLTTVFLKTPIKWESPGLIIGLAKNWQLPSVVGPFNIFGQSGSGCNGKKRGTLNTQDLPMNSLIIRCSLVSYTEHHSFVVE